LNEERLECERACKGLHYTGQRKREIKRERGRERKKGRERERENKGGRERERKREGG